MGSILDSVLTANRAGRDDRITAARDGILSRYSGDNAATGSKLLQAGDTAGAADLQTYGINAQNMQATTDKAHQEAETHILGQAQQLSNGLLQIPYEKRKEAFANVIAPALKQMHFDDGVIAQMGQADLTDDTLKALSTALGEKAKSYSAVNAGNGYVGSFDPTTGNMKTLREADPTVTYEKVQNADGSETVLSLPKNGVGVGAASGGGDGATSAPEDTRAARNNNPGNLRDDGKSKWQGMAGVDSGGFVQFDSPENGQRAAGINLANQSKLHGLDTLTGIITKYAPKSDGNDTAAYIQSVAQQTGLDPNAKLDLSDVATRNKILTAMYAVEGGGTPAKVPAKPQGGQASGGGATVVFRSDSGGVAAGSDLTPEALDSAADYYNSTGLMPTLGMGKKAVASRTAILNRAAEKKQGDVALSAADYKANASTLRKLSEQRGAVAGYEHTVQANLGIVDQLLAKGSGSFKAPVLNRVQQHARKEYAGDPEVTAYESALQTVISEYAKVMSGSMGNTAVSDSARNHAEKLLNTSLNADQVKANIAVMRQEMSNRLSGMDNEIATTRARIGGNDGSSDGEAQKPAQGAQNVVGPKGQVTDAQHAAWKSHFKAGSRYGSEGAPWVVSTQEEYDHVKAGEHYIDPDGNVVEKH